MVTHLTSGWRNIMIEKANEEEYFPGSRKGHEAVESHDYQCQKGERKYRLFWIVALA